MVREASACAMRQAGRAGAGCGGHSLAAFGANVWGFLIHLEALLRMRGLPLQKISAGQRGEERVHFVLDQRGVGQRARDFLAEAMPVALAQAMDGHACARLR